MTIKVVRARGDAFTRGASIGEGFSDEIRASVDFNLRYFARHDLGGNALEATLQPFLYAAERGLPHRVRTIRGMAEGAGVPFADMFVPNVFEELDAIVQRSAPAKADHCSDISVVAPGVTLLAHNENWFAGDIGSVGLVVEIPEEADDPAIVSPTAASYLPSVGMNARGGAVGVMSVSAPDDGVGVPRVLVSRDALAAADRDDAIRRAGIRGRSGGYAYTYAFAGGEAFTIETTASDIAVWDGPGCHTNHYLDPGLASKGDAGSAGSHSRRERLVALTAEHEPSSAEDLMAFLSDHGSTPAALCTHPDPAEGEDGDAVLFSMVCDLEARRMWVAVGNPCVAPYEEVDLSDLG